MEKQANYFLYVVSFCLFIWGMLFLDKIFSWEYTATISKITALIEIFINFITIIPIIKIHKSMNSENRSIFGWLTITAIGIFIGDIFWYWLMYLNNSNPSHLVFRNVVIDIIPFYIWNIALIIFFFKVLNKYVLQDKRQLNIFWGFALINLIIISLFLFSIHYVGSVTVMEITSLVVQIILFDFVILGLIYSEKPGLTLFISGFIFSIAGNFLCMYSTILQTSATLSYGELLYLLGLLFVWFGIYTIYSDGDYEIKNWFRKNTSIKGKLAFWCFGVGIISFLSFFIMAYFFSIISQGVFTGLPLFIMLYSVVVVMLSLYMGKNFEMPFKQLSNNINILTRNSTISIDNNFSTEEFMFLQGYINEAFKKQKEAERLNYESEIERERAQSALKEEQLKTDAQENFKKAVGQMMHDITSPITSINTIISKLGSNIAENDRITLRHASDRIEGISQRLLNQYKKNTTDESEDLLVSLALLQIINEKREEYIDSGIIFETDIEEDARFCFIRHNLGMFKRMLSNLINNSVDALKNKADAKVKLTLAVHARSIIIIVKDNGSGISQYVQDKFKQGITVTEGKKNGHGLGLTQVREAIKFGNGECAIYSSDSVTKITIYFPLIAMPQWVTTEIKLTRDDTVIILDDDESIHGAWDNKFENVLIKVPTLQIKHFTHCKDVIQYINNLEQKQKQNTYLLADYELLEQGMNGLDVVEQTNMERSILVTSYATNTKIQDRVMQLGIKILPKELVSSAQIQVDKKIKKGSKVVDMVWVEDQKWFVDGLVKKLYSHLNVDVYYDPISFMEDVIQYPLNTRIILDTYYEDENETPYIQTGYAIAKVLHGMGFTKLILFSGEHKRADAPDYLQVLSKKDSYATENLDKI